MKTFYRKFVRRGGLSVMMGGMERAGLSPIGSGKQACRNQVSSLKGAQE